MAGQNYLLWHKNKKRGVQFIRNKRQSHGECWRICFVDNKKCTVDYQVGNPQTIKCKGGFTHSCNELLQIIYDRYKNQNKFDDCSIQGTGLTTVTCEASNTG